MLNFTFTFRPTYNLWEWHVISDIQGGSDMTGTDLCVNKSQFVPVIFEPPCISDIMHLFGKDFGQNLPQEWNQNFKIRFSQISVTFVGEAGLPD
jgi:hypothetical protein